MRKFKEGDYVSFVLGDDELLGVVIHYVENFVIVKERIIGGIYSVFEEFLTPTDYRGNKILPTESHQPETEKQENQETKKFKEGDIVNWENKYITNGYSQKPIYGYVVIGHEMDKTIIECRTTGVHYKANTSELSIMDAYGDNINFSSNNNNSSTQGFLSPSFVGRAVKNKKLVYEAQARQEGGEQYNLLTKERSHPHYFKNVEHLQKIDVYRVITLFDVTNPCLAHAIKKLLVAGGPGGGKSIEKDVKEAIDSLARFIEIQKEDLNKLTEIQD